MTFLFACFVKHMGTGFEMSGLHVNSCFKGMKITLFQSEAGPSSTLTCSHKDEF